MEDAVTLRCRSAAEASKGDGDAKCLRPSFEARKSAHLRMTSRCSATLVI
jgi:hypothetical protein